MTDESHIHFAAWRKRAGLKQVEAAAIMDMVQGYLSGLENGSKPWNQRVLAKMASAYDCTVADLFRDPDEPATKWASIYKRIPSDRRDQAIRTAESFADSPQRPLKGGKD